MKSQVLLFLKYFKIVLKVLLGIIAVPVLYLLVSLVLSFIPVNSNSTDPTKEHTIYLSTNGIHVDIILPIESIQEELLKDLKRSPADLFFAFGWGEENFYMNTPQWSDLSFRTAFNATFLDNNTLIHIKRHQRKHETWTRVTLNDEELRKMNLYILNSFQLNPDGNKVLLEGKGYSLTDDFYEAQGRYSFHQTSNSWANKAFKQSGLKAALWTPFDFGLINKYK